MGDLRHRCSPTVISFVCVAWYRRAAPFLSCERYESASHCVERRRDRVRAVRHASSAGSQCSFLACGMEQGEAQWDDQYRMLNEQSSRVECSSVHPSDTHRDAVFLHSRIRMRMSEGQVTSGIEYDQSDTEATSHSTHSTHEEMSGQQLEHKRC